MRDRLIELMRQAENKHLNLLEFEKGILADYLLENGVIVPPVKVGQTVYVLDKGLQVWWECEVITLYYTHFYTNGNDVQVNVKFKDGEVRTYDMFAVFLTREDAEKALNGGAE